MLYDPKWERPSLAGFRAWLGQQDQDATFAYVDCERCAVGQYLQSLGSSWRKADSGIVDKLNMFALRACNFGSADYGYGPTFGAVLLEINKELGS